MTSEDHVSLDKLALSLCIGGVIAAVAVALTGELLGHNFRMTAYCIFVAFQIAALVLGIITRATPLGKAALITAGTLLIGFLALLS